MNKLFVIFIVTLSTLGAQSFSQSKQILFNEIYKDRMLTFYCNNPYEIKTIKGKPKGSKINNDNVSLEAGRKKGTIKKSRPVFNELIEEIKKANEKDIKPILEAQDKADKYKEKFIHYKKYMKNV